jgi:hypothetical protein
MSGTTARYVPLLPLLLIPTLGLMAQQSPQSTIGAPPTTLVRATKLIDDATSAFASLQSTLPTALARGMVVISNGSSNSIDAISTVWKITGPDGRVTTLNQRCDIFLAGQSGRHVALPNARILVGAKSCYPDHNVPPADLIVNMEKSLSAVLAVASQVNIVVEAIAFDNGDAYETNGSYLAEIVDRVNAAHQVAAVFRSGLASGQDASQILSQLKVLSQGATGFQGHWIVDYGTSVSHGTADQMAARINAMDRIPIPIFVTRSNSK